MIGNKAQDWQHGLSKMFKVIRLRLRHGGREADGQRQILTAHWMIGNSAQDWKNGLYMMIKEIRVKQRSGGRRVRGGGRMDSDKYWLFIG